MESKLKLGILASGALGFHVLKSLYKTHTISFIATNSTSNQIVELSTRNKTLLFVGNPRKGKLFKALNGIDCDVVLSVNYLYLIEKDVINLPKKHAINFHGSLLPKYRGRTPHVWAIINGEKECGITAHLINEACDTGAILYQKKVNILADDTGQKILDKYKLQYPFVVNKVLSMIENNSLSPREQAHEKATFFGKRTPDDGQIDWSWQKERIYNWIRAQAYPYPGAFTFYEGVKIVIDSLSYTDLGFDNAVENGTIVKVYNNIPCVKTSNGVLKLKEIRNLNEVRFYENSILK